MTKTQELTPESLADAVKRVGESYSPANMLQDFPEAKGDFCLVFGKSNVEFFHGISKEATGSLQEAVDRGLVHVHFTEILVYFVDGCLMPDRPLAKRPPKDGYKERHWIPTVLYSGPRCAQEDCPGA